MPAGLMRFFGKSTRTQLIVLGLALTVLGAIGAFGVMFLPNETPASLISSPDKGQYYTWQATWAMLGFFIVLMTGLLLLGTALTGLPFVHMAKYHTGVFYVSIFSLVLIPTALALKSAGALMGDAAADTVFAETLSGDTFTSPAGLLGLVVGLVVLGLSVVIILLNLLHLGKVAYRPSLVKGGAVMGVVLTLVLVLTYTFAPMMVALQFDHADGRQGAVGFEEFPPQDVTYVPGWLGWLSDAEYRSTYGSMANWLGFSSFMILIAIVLSVLGFIGLALYSANDRGPNTLNLSLTPLASIFLVVLALLFYIAYSGALDQVAERLNVSSEVTKITYGSGTMYVAFVMMLVAIGAGVGYALTLKDWLTVTFKGKKVADPISMDSLVDPPTGLPSPPTGWPADWSRMSISNMAVVAVAVLLVLAGTIGGGWVKGKESTSSDFVPTGDGEVVVLDELSDKQRPFPFNDTAAEGANRSILWQPDGVWFIKRMELYVSWDDETPRFRHENMPDVFEGTIAAGTGESIVQTGQSTTTTLHGELRCSIEFDKYILMTSVPGLDLPEEVVRSNITVTIRCTDAGDQVPIGTGFLTFPDDGNSFSATLTVDYKLYQRQS
jgi:hypothetical protein